MQRRALLSATAAALFTAGCGQRTANSTTRNRNSSSATSVESTSPSTTTTDSTSTTTTVQRPQRLAVDETATVDGGSVRVTRLAAQRSVFALSVAHHTDVFVPPDAQFVVAAFQTTLPDGVDDARAFTVLELDGERYPRADLAFSPTGDGFQLAYRLPLSLDVSTGRLVWREMGDDIAYWTLPDVDIERLNHPPEFEVTGFEAPDTVQVDTEIVASVSVRNTGTGAGTFRTELGRTSFSDLGKLRVPLGPGDHRTVQDGLGRIFEAGKTETIVLDWGAGRKERTVEIVD